MENKRFRKRKQKQAQAAADAADQSANGFLTKEDILNAEDIHFEAVDVPEWATGKRLKVRLRTLSGKDRDAYQASLLVDPATGSQEVRLQNATARLLSHCIVNGDGSLMFSEDEVSDLGEKSGIALNRVYMVASRLAALTKADLEELIEAQKKTPNDNSSSS